MIASAHYSNLFHSLQLGHIHGDGNEGLIFTGLKMLYRQPTRKARASVMKTENSYHKQVWHVSLNIAYAFSGDDIN